MKNKKYLIILFIIVLIFLFIFKNNYSKNNINDIDLDSVVGKNEVENNTNIEEEKIKVHIIGEVNSPGLLELPVGSRIFDAINEAGRSN